MLWPLAPSDRLDRSDGRRTPSACSTAPPAPEPRANDWCDDYRQCPHVWGWPSSIRYQIEATHSLITSFEATPWPGCGRCCIALPPHQTRPVVPKEKALKEPQGAPSLLNPRTRRGHSLRYSAQCPRSVSSCRTTAFLQRSHIRTAR
jgi:hypothetical protein